MPREGHLAGCQVSPLREGAPQVSPQARALGESTLGWAGHAQLKCPRPARLPPPHLLQPLALETSGWQREHGGAESERRRLLQAWRPAPPPASCSRTPAASPLFSSGVPTASVPRPQVPACRAGREPTGRGRASPGTHLRRPWGKAASALGFATRRDGGQLSACDGGSRRHPEAARRGVAMPACPRTHRGASGRW